VVPSLIERFNGSLNLRPTFTLGVKANGELKSSIPIGAKDEISLSRGFTLGVKAETEKIISICPKLLIK
jgi:hypothetical protein